MKLNIIRETELYWSFALAKRESPRICLHFDSIRISGNWKGRRTTKRFPNLATFQGSPNKRQGLRKPRYSIRITHGSLLPLYFKTAADRRHETRTVNLKEAWLRTNLATTPDDKVTDPSSSDDCKEEDSNRLEQHNLITGDAIQMNFGRERFT